MESFGPSNHPRTLTQSELQSCYQRGVLRCNKFAVGLEDRPVKQIIYSQLYCHPYMLTTMYELIKHNSNSRRTICEALHEMFLKRQCFLVIKSILNEDVNKQNMRYWPKEQSQGHQRSIQFNGEFKKSDSNFKDINSVLLKYFPKNLISIKADLEWLVCFLVECFLSSVLMSAIEWNLQVLRLDREWLLVVCKSWKKPQKSAYRMDNGKHHLWSFQNSSNC